MNKDNLKNILVFCRDDAHKGTGRIVGVVIHTTSKGVTQGNSIALENAPMTTTEMIL